VLSPTEHRTRDDHCIRSRECTVSVPGMHCIGPGNALYRSREHTISAPIRLKMDHGLKRTGRVVHSVRCTQSPRTTLRRARLGTKPAEDSFVTVVAKPRRRRSRERRSRDREDDVHDAREDENAVVRVRARRHRRARDGGRGRARERVVAATRAAHDARVGVGGAERGGRANGGGCARSGASVGAGNVGDLVRRSLGDDSRSGEDGV